MMKPTLSTSGATTGKADLLVVILDDRQTLAQTPRHLAAVVADARKRFDAQPLKRELLLPPARAGQPHLLVCHTALAAPFAGAEAVRIIEQHGDAEAGLYLYVAFQNVHTAIQSAGSIAGHQPLHAPCATRTVSLHLLVDKIIIEFLLLNRLSLVD